MGDHTETSASSSAASVGKRSRDHAEAVSTEIVKAERIYKDAMAGSWAYAKLAGTGKGAIDYLIRTKHVTIGRVGYGADCQLRSENRTVSRHHATIEWTPDFNSWAIACHSKSNGLIVDGAPVLVNTPPMPLRSRNLIEVGDAAFFFLACVNPAVHTADIEALEKEIDVIRTSRKRKREYPVIEVRSSKSSRRVLKESGRSSHLNQRRGVVPGDEDVADEYDDDLVNKNDDDDSAEHLRHANASLSYNRRITNDKSKDSRANKHKMKRSRDDASGHVDISKGRRHDRCHMDENDPVDKHLHKRELDIFRDKSEKKKKSKKKKKKKGKKLGETPHGNGLGETEDEKDDSPEYDARESLRKSLESEVYDDGFDTAPVPSLRDHKILRGSQAQQSTAGKFRAEWNKKERADFGRAIFAVGVDEVYDGDGNLVAYDWTRFRGIAKLEKKSDAMLAEYYRRMMGDVETLLEEEAREKRTKGPRTKHKPGCDCVVCENTRKSRRKKEQENVNADFIDDIDESNRAQGDMDQDPHGGDDVDGGTQETGGDVNEELAQGVERVIGLVTAQKLRVRMGIHEAARQVDSTAGQSVMRKLRSQPRNQAANGELPSWWVNGVHDHALMIGTARHGVGQWADIWADLHNPELVRTRSDEGENIKWPSAQVAMKRLREVSSAINAEIRRIAKKRARTSSDVTTKSSSKLTSKPGKAPNSDSKTRKSPVKASGKAQKRKLSTNGRRISEATTEKESWDGDVDYDTQNFDETTDEGRYEENDAMDDVVADDGNDEEIEIEIEEEDAEDEDDEEIEIEIEEDEDDDGDEEGVQYNTESDSGQTD